MSSESSGVASLCAALCLFPAAALAADASPDEGDAEVVVTGSHIRGAPPAGVNLITITQDDLRKGGFTRIEEALRSLPQNFGGGPRDDTYLQQIPGNDRSLSTNTSKGASVNLRGLGAGATLILVDGRRLAPSGSTGLFTDISNIPVTAIERIEVLTDGASALYGSDAVGGVVNVILRKDFSGAETGLRGVAGAGGTRDYSISQSFGHAWEGGRAQVSYEYLRRDALRATERSFSADSDQRRNGGDNLSSPGGNPGTIVIGNRNWAIPANQDGTQLTPASFVEGTVNYRNESEFLWLLPEQDRQGVTASASHDLTGRLTLWAQGMMDWRTSHALLPWAEVLTVPRTNAYYVNPTGGSGPLTIRYDLTEDFGEVFSDTKVRVYAVDAGVDVKVGSTWKATLDVSRSEERAARSGFGIDRPALGIALADSNRATALNPFGDGAFTDPATIDTLRGTTYGLNTSALTATNLLAEGPVLRAPGGDLRLALGAEYRDYSYDSFNGTTNSVGSTLLTTAKASRHLDSFYAELRLPLIGERNRFTGFHQLALSAAVRREQYSDFGDSTVPKFGLSWSPFAPLTIRGTWSRSFRAPDLSSLDESRNGFLLTTLPDAQAPGGNSTVLRWSGGNALLRPETADNLTAGFDLSLPRVTGLRLSATYFDIDYRNRIGSPFAGLTSQAEFLANPRYADYVIRNPDAALREQICSGVASTTSQAACLSTPIAAIIDLRTANTAVLSTSGIDAELRFSRDASFGSLTASVAGTYILSYEQATTENTPTLSLLNRKYAPIDTRLRGSLGWSRGAWSTTTFINYVDDYKDVSATSVRAVESWTTVDLDVTYSIGESQSFLSGTSLSLNAQNLLNSNPPFVNTQFGYDVTNANPYGRVASVLLRKRW